MIEAYPSRDPYNTTNWFGASLYGYDGSIRGGINEAYADVNKLVNLEGVKNHIDWDSAAALEYFGPSSLNKDRQQQIQAVLANVATVSLGWSPTPNWIRVRCNDPLQICSYKCPPTTQEDKSQAGVIAYARNPDSGAGRRNPVYNQDISNYFSRASAFLHEILHLNLAADCPHDCPTENLQAEDVDSSFEVGKPIPHESYPDAYWREWDKWIKSLGSDEAAGKCNLMITEIWTCEDVASNLYARLTLTNPESKTLYRTPGSAHSPGQPINDNGPLHISEVGMKDTLVITGEHTNDYILFNYGSVSWTSSQTDGDARCSLEEEDWDKNLPPGCPNAAAIMRTFKCEYPC
ncbi:hypothetical protein DL765_007223 [Monosporascus sp. GIB2]|nr:hypothetical protein DL765_007223 [Monosporascus sp. GIB2]